MMGKPKIAIFTEFYPFGQGEEFLENEMKVAEKHFAEIAIVSFGKDTKNITKYIPKNAAVLSVRESIGRRTLLAKRFLSVASPDVWHQTIQCVKERGLEAFAVGMKSAILEHSLISVLKSREDLWVGKFNIYYSYWLSGAASYLALSKNILRGSVVSRAHGYDCFFNRGFHAHRKKQFECLDAIYPISEAGKTDLVSQGGLQEKIHVCRLGVNKNNDTLNPYIESQIKTIVTCSNIVDLKRLDLLIEALSRIDGICVQWVHFGDGVLREQITDLAKEKLESKNNITYEFKGWMLPAEVLKYYESNSVDLFVNCSDVEGIPVSIMEAMSYGIPCIARDVGGNNEIVNDENGSLLPNICSAEMLKAGIESIFSLPEPEYSRKRACAVETYRTKYDAKKNYSVFFEEMVNQYG